MTSRVKCALSVVAGAAVGASVAYWFILRDIARGMDEAFGY